MQVASILWVWSRGGKGMRVRLIIHPTQIRKTKYFSVIYQHLCFSMNLSVTLFVHVSVCQEVYLYMCFLVDVHVSLLSESLVIHLCVCVCVCVCVCISVWLYLWAIHDAYLTVKRIKKLQLGPMILLDYSRLSSSSLEKANQWLLILAGKKKITWEL